jgi:hypothetical protein
VQPSGPGTQGYNPYAYVANNPTTFTDPSGHRPAALGPTAPAGAAAGAGGGGGEPFQRRVVRHELAASTVVRLSLACILTDRCRKHLVTGIGMTFGSNNGLVMNAGLAISTFALAACALDIAVRAGIGPAGITLSGGDACYQVFRFLLTKGKTIIITEPVEAPGTRPQPTPTPPPAPVPVPTPPMKCNFNGNQPLLLKGTVGNPATGAGGWGMDHIMHRHAQSSTQPNTSKFNTDSALDISTLIWNAFAMGAGQWRLEGPTKCKQKFRMNEIVGTDRKTGPTMCMVIIIANDDAGTVITTYPETC